MHKFNFSIMLRAQYWTNHLVTLLAVYGGGLWGMIGLIQNNFPHCALPLPGFCTPVSAQMLFIRQLSIGPFPYAAKSMQNCKNWNWTIRIDCIETCSFSNHPSLWTYLDLLKHSLGQQSSFGVKYVDNASVVRQSSLGGNRCITFSVASAVEEQVIQSLSYQWGLELIKLWLNSLKMSCMLHTFLWYVISTTATPLCRHCCSSLYAKVLPEWLIKWLPIYYWPSPSHHKVSVLSGNQQCLLDALVGDTTLPNLHLWLGQNWLGA